MNAKKTTTLLALAGCMLALATDSLAGKNFDATIQFNVRDLKGAAVPDAQVDARLSYFSYKPYGRRNQTFSAQADAEGNAAIAGQTYGRMDYEVSGPAIYSTRYRLSFAQPNRTEKVIVRPIISPGPMVALKGVNKLVPILKESVGFDLLKADWMPPHGQGEHQDLEVVADGKPGSEKYWGTIHIRFSGQKNGIRPMKRRPAGQQSDMRSGYKAPAAGYLSTAAFEETNGYAAKTNYKWAAVQYIRIRENLYGKIYGNLVSMDSKGPVLRLEYLFVNPEPNSRNMEFDPTQNRASEYNPVVDAKALKVDLP